MRVSLSVVIIAMVKTGKSNEMKPILRDEIDINKLYIDISSKINAS